MTLNIDILTSEANLLLREHVGQLPFHCDISDSGPHCRLNTVNARTEYYKGRTVMLGVFGLKTNELNTKVNSVRYIQTVNT